MKTALLFLGVCLVAVSSLPAVEPSTSAQRERFLQIAHSLEKDAFSDEARTQRAWAMTFIENAPDIRVEINLDAMAELTRAAIPNRPALENQFILGFAAFQMEHPENGTGQVAAAYVAAFASCLKVYHQAVALNPTNQMVLFDALVQKDRNGTLQDYVVNLLASLTPRPAPAAPVTPTPAAESTAP